MNMAKVFVKITQKKRKRRTVLVMLITCQVNPSIVINLF